MSRDLLPFRETCDCFVLHKGKLLALQKPGFFVFPGGGLDKGESALVAAKRELREETGGVIQGQLTHFTTVTWKWFPTWAKSDKQKERYKLFQGEKIHIFLGDIAKFGKATSNEGDKWSGKKLHKIESVLEGVLAQKDHSNMDTYKLTQVLAIKALAVLNKDRKRTLCKK